MTPNEPNKRNGGAMDVALTHRTIRAFQEAAVPEEDVRRLLEVARMTASSVGMQASSILRITDPKQKRRLSEVSGQPYVATAPELWVFLVDQHRNAKVLKEKGADGALALDMDFFFQSFTDACLMAQNVNLCAESLGYGAVFLGSLLNDPGRTIEILQLPQGTFPVLGLGFGRPDQDPQMKPRMPMQLRVFTNEYPQEDEPLLPRLTEYDETMQTYYDLRNANQRVDSFTDQVVARYSAGLPERKAILSWIQRQGFGVPHSAEQ
ncbi:Oxygen-insensitive NADPH nitroreductase [Clostridiaceae bacterium JG1575]|nr:Oxygen-insensitive NADPH nitroreductase [Clostridiaceae bacterium JG1575]